MTLNRRAVLLEGEHGLLRRMWSHRLFRRMLARQGVDAALATITSQATEMMLLRALHTCSHCMQKERCQAWLAGTEPSAGYVRFCPNSETIEALRIAAPRQVEEKKGGLAH